MKTLPSHLRFTLVMGKLADGYVAAIPTRKESGRQPWYRIEEDLQKLV